MPGIASPGSPVPGWPLGTCGGLFAGHLGAPGPPGHPEVGPPHFPALDAPHAMRCGMALRRSLRLYKSLAHIAVATTLCRFRSFWFGFWFGLIINGDHQRGSSTGINRYQRRSSMGFAPTRKQHTRPRTQTRTETASEQILESSFWRPTETGSEQILGSAVITRTHRNGL